MLVRKICATANLVHTHVVACSPALILYPNAYDFVNTAHILNQQTYDKMVKAQKRKHRSDLSPTKPDLLVRHMRVVLSKPLYVNSTHFNRSGERHKTERICGNISCLLHAKASARPKTIL